MIDKSVTERLGERMGYKNRGRNKRNNRGPRGRGGRGGHGSGGADDDHWSRRSGAPQSAKTHQWYQVTVSKDQTPDSKSACHSKYPTRTSIKYYS